MKDLKTVDDSHEVKLNERNILSAASDQTLLIWKDVKYQLTLSHFGSFSSTLDQQVSPPPSSHFRLSHSLDAVMCCLVGADAVFVGRPHNRSRLTPPSGAMVRRT